MSIPAMPEADNTLEKILCEVRRLAERIDQLSQFGNGLDDKAVDDNDGSAARYQRPALPDPRLIRRIIRLRQLRSQFFDAELFGEPAWDMLLDLTAARVEQKRVSVTSLCYASGVPATTALRWISIMVESGLFERISDDIDKRRAFIGLSDKAANAMANYFQKTTQQDEIL